MGLLPAARDRPGGGGGAGAGRGSLPAGEAGLILLGHPTAYWLSQLVLGLQNGAFYALLSLGLAVIFGMLGIVNFAHGALFTLGAYGAWMLTAHAGLGLGPALLIAPLAVALLAAVLEKTLIRRLRGLDPIYGLLLTFGIALIIEGVLRNLYGTAGLPYQPPSALSGAINLGFMFLPRYRAAVVGIALLVCLLTWALIERTRLGAMLRAATENASIAQALGINVPRLVTWTYAGGAGLAALAGVLAAPIFSVNPAMGSQQVNTVFAVVIVGGMGSIAGSVATGFMLGIVQGLTKVVYPPGTDAVIFLVMILVLLIRPRGLFGAPA